MEVYRLVTQGEGLLKLIRKGENTNVINFRHSDKPGSLSTDFIRSLCFDHKGNLWIGTENGGLNYLSRNSNEFITYLSNDMPQTASEAILFGH